jgi:hypothetical protein
MFNQQLVSYLEKEGRNWIVTQRDAHWAKGHTLESSTRCIIGSFFQSNTLDSARICQVSQIDNPLFYEGLKKTGISMPLDFRDMAGITFIDTILIATSKIGAGDWNLLIFHECIHLAQYSFLGVNRFVHEYVTGWANNNFDYYKIPLEIQAYELQEHFNLNPKNVFSVEAEIVKKWGKHLIG